VSPGRSLSADGRRGPRSLETVDRKWIGEAARLFLYIGS